MFFMIFIERRKPEIILAWFVVFTFFPFVGFLIYLLIGNGLHYKTSKMIKKMQIQQKEYFEIIEKQKSFFLKKNKKQQAL